MVCKDTLRFKHLPKELTDAQKEDFVRHFGAQKVKVLTSKAKAKSTVYAKFENEDVAKNVMLRLHQITILNCRLCVEYAEADILQGQLTSQKVSETSESTDKRFFKNFINSINAFNDSVGFYQPPPSHLKYNYPKANRPTINNIAHALATVPRFYTQVLHLMNKMNLPPPFAVPDSTSQNVQAIHSKPQQLIKVQNSKRKVSSSESELESDEDTKPREIIPDKKVPLEKQKIKRPKFIKPPVVQTNPAKVNEKVENVFEKVELQTQKKIELKVAQDMVVEGGSKEKDAIETSVSKNALEENNPETNLQKEPTLAESKLEPKAQVALEQVQKEAKPKDEDDKLQISVEQQNLIVEEHNREPEDEFPCISLEELRANQITDLTVMPVFKNYNAGEPTNKLYIKNCAKTVDKQDLEYIFNRYREEATEDKPSEFNIRLMKEGRMKGQAFITLDSVEQAEKAVKETNGFILKDKPLVVVFGKAGKKN